MTEIQKLPTILTLEEIAAIVIDISFQIHRKWGPGLLESVYEALLVHHLRSMGFLVEQQKPIPFEEDGIRLDIGFRADILVENQLLVELKSVEQVAKSHYKIVLTYLRILDLRLGLLINFGEALLKDGIKRIVNNY